jgi:hypothetical protein
MPSESRLRTALLPLGHGNRATHHLDLAALYDALLAGPATAGI